MRDLSAIKLLDLMPENLRADETIKNACAAIQVELDALNQQLSVHVMLPRISELSGAVLDHLAHQFHLDYYRDDAPDAMKRELIADAINSHRKHGTKSAVKAVLDTLFDNATVEEWWEYGGDPYTFRVKVENPRFDILSSSDAIAAINAVKNVRSHFTAVAMDREILGHIYRAGVVYYRAKTTISIPEEVSFYIASVAMFGDTISIYP